jgi:hypothetical protein
MMEPNFEVTVPEKKSSCTPRFVLLVLGVAVALFAAATLALAIALGITIHGTGSSCAAPSYEMSEAAKRASIFADLTDTEIKSVVDFLVNSNKDLNIVAASAETGMDQNYIQYMEKFAPIKTDALAYLNGETDKKPARYVRVIVARGADATPANVEYKVGPLPISSESKATVYKTIAFSKRLVDKIEYGYIDALVLEFGKTIENITMELAGAKYTEDCGEACLTYADTAPRAWKVTCNVMHVTITAMYFLRMRAISQC